MEEQTPLALNDKSQVTIDLKSFIAVITLLITISGVYFTLTGSLSAVELSVIRMQDSVKMNEEFRIKWPRGELGALPDDAVQDLNIEYLQEKISLLQAEFDTHIKEHEREN
jgi:hypothetical protein